MQNKGVCLVLVCTRLVLYRSVIADRKIINIDSLYKWYLCVCIFCTSYLTI